MSNNNIAVSVKNLTKIYKLYDKHIDRLKESINPLGKKYHNEFYALKNVSFDVKKGEVLGIVGKNGSGKSTLLSIISGVLAPSSGKVNTRGRISPLLGLESGFNSELTGIENIYFYGTIRGYSKGEMDEKVKEILSFADFGDFIYQPIKIYSSGMKARLSFAVAINIDPEILIVDEVLSVGDELFRRKCYAKMEEIFKAGCTVLFVSHAVNTINEICTRAILLDRGELILKGQPKMVTMYYQKFLFAKPQNALKIRNEITQLNKNEEKKKKFATNLEKTEEKPAEKEKEETKINEKNQETKPKAFYIPDFKPKSTIEYKNYDIDVYEVHISTPEGLKVNALTMNDEYLFNYKVRFNVNAERVVFSMAIKNEKGLVVSSSITGSKSEKCGKIIKSIQKGSIYSISWNFKCKLITGNYYTNIGIGSFPEKKESFVLNRISDALVFKVQDIPGSLYGGICYLNQSVEICELEK